MHAKKQWILLGLAGLLMGAPAARAQVRPYISYAYPAGGRQGATLQIRLGGQGLDGAQAVRVSGTGVTARVAAYYRRLSFEEHRLLLDQLRLLKKSSRDATADMAMTSMASMNAEPAAAHKAPASARDALAARIEQRLEFFTQRPANDALASTLVAEISIAPDAPPGARELRVLTGRGVSNPLVFQVGQLPEHAVPPLRPTELQVLGKEAQAFSPRPAEELDRRITLPATVNGQLASGEIHRYRFAARRGQRLLFVAQARELIPFIADAVPGWLQPVLELYAADGREIACDDGGPGRLDPVRSCEIPRDGEYVCAIHDSLYRGREDFVYRLTLGELPWVTGLFPLGGAAGFPTKIEMTGWNLAGAELPPPAWAAGPGRQLLAARRPDYTANPMWFALDTGREAFEQEAGRRAERAQAVSVPVFLNGRIDRPGDTDVYRFTGRSNDVVVAEVYARRMGSPLDAVLKLTDTRGKLLAINDDHEDLASGLNTHHADAYLTARLPASGAYDVRLGDAAGKGGIAYGYRLRLSAPQPDFELRVVPSSVSLRRKGTARVSVYALRKEGFDGPIRLALQNPPVGFAAQPCTLAGTQAVAQLTLKTDLTDTEEPVALVVEGRAQADGRELVRSAVPAEDRMQAFLWRHLVPAQEFLALVFDPAEQPRPPRPPKKTVAPVAVTTNATVQAKSARRLWIIEHLYEERLLAEDFYREKVAECEAAETNVPPAAVTQPPAQPKS